MRLSSRRRAPRAGVANPLSSSISQRETPPFQPPSFTATQLRPISPLNIRGVFSCTYIPHPYPGAVYMQPLGRDPQSLPNLKCRFSVNEKFALETFFHVKYGFLRDCLYFLTRHVNVLLIYRFLFE